MNPTTNQGLLLPDADELNNVPAHMAQYNDGVENRLVQRYLSSIDREVRNPNPKKGEISYRQDVDLHERYDGTAWRNLRGGVDHFYLPGELGTTLVTFSNQNTFTQIVNFQVPFAQPPVVLTNISSTAGSTSAWISRAYLVGTSSFTLFVQSATLANSSWTNIVVDWVAIGRQ